MARKKVTPAPRPQSPGMMARILPPLGFILAFSLLAAFCHTISHGATLSPAQRYEAAKDDMDALRQDNKRGMQRAPWEEVAASFHAIHQNATTWANRPAALFKAAECYEELSRRSFAISDARKAAGTFEEVARQHESSRLADDALLRAARIRADRLKDTRGALKLLDTLCRDYPRGDMYAEARRLRQELAPGKDAPQPSVQPARQISDTPPADDARQALQRYENAKKTMELLRADKRRSCWREPWENLQGDFMQVYQSRPNATVSAAALFRAGVSARSLADCSHLAADYRTARTLLLRVPEEFPGSALADDALLQAAQISAEELKDRTEAVRLLAAPRPCACWPVWKKNIPVATCAPRPRPCGSSWPPPLRTAVWRMPPPARARPSGSTMWWPGSRAFPCSACSSTPGTADVIRAPSTMT